MATPDRTVDASWIAEHLNDPSVALIEVDVSSAAYDAGHIPGAVLWNAYTDLRDADYLPIGRGALEELMARAGVQPEGTVVVYGYAAALGFWLLTASGHRDVRVMPGPREQWLAAGTRWSTSTPAAATGAYAFAGDVSDLATLDQVRDTIGDPQTVLLDVRSELEFRGERFWPSGATEGAGRSGHIPGATNIPIDTLRTQGGEWKLAAELRATFGAAGVTADKTVIAYCTIGNRAAQAWFALKHLLGYPRVQVYYGSWVEWGKSAGTPIET